MADFTKTSREQDRNLLFGVLAVQLKQVTPAQLVAAAALWAADPALSLPERLVRSEAITESDRKLLDDFVDRAIAANDSDVTKTLAAFGGDDEILNSFQGTVVRTPGGWNISDETIAGAPPPDLASDALHVEPPGRYHERGEQGRGGMGRVLLVDDRDLGREIVMKVLLDDNAKRASAKSDQRSASKRARFLQEAQITGQLEHPSIVPVYELGQRKDATPYYTMKYVRGETLSKRLKKCSTLKDRLALLPHYADLCQAIAYAHSRGVIHRDLKPANVMVGEYGETVVIDWGLAKVKGRRDVQLSQLEEGIKTVKLESDSVPSADRTRMGEVMGTPVYMPPEQARGDIDQIDERSDVYALGAILYQIITGEKPFSAPTPEKIVDKVISESPTPIEAIEKNAPPELVAICERAMLKDPDARYPGAQALAEEIERFQSGAIVQAYEYRPAEYLGKFIRRHRPILGTAALAIVALVAISAWYVTSILRANEDLATAAILEAGLRAAAEQEAYQSTIVLAQNEIAQQEPEAARRLLREAPERLRDWEWGYLYRVSDQSLMTLANHSAPLTWGQFSGDGSFAATASEDGTLRVWDTATGAERFALLGHGVKVFGAAILPGDKQLASVSVDGIVKRWSLTNGELIDSIGELQDDIRGMAVSRDGTRLATASLSGSVTVFELGSTPPFRTLEVLDAKGLWSVAFDAAGARAAAGGDTGIVGMYDAATGAVLRTFEGHTETVRAIAFSSNGERLATASDDDTAVVWNTRTGEAIHTLAGHGGDVMDVAFGEGGRTVITASLDRTARIWDASTGLETRALIGHTLGLTGLALSGDERSLLTTALDETARVWSLESGAVKVVLTGHSGAVVEAAFNPKGDRILTVSNDETAKVWDARTGSDQVVITGHGHIVADAAFSPDGTRVATASWDKTARIWNASTGELVHELVGHEGFVDSAAYSPDGTRVVTASWDHTAKVWDADTGAMSADLLGHSDIVESASFSPDGQSIVTASPDKSARIWNALTGEETASFAGHDTGILYAAFSPDGTRLVTTSLDRTARIWDRASLATTAVLEGHERAVTHAAFSSDGTRVVTTSSDRTARLWDVATGELLFVLRGHLGGVWGAAFRDDSMRVATASHDGTVRLWDVTNGAELLTLGGQQEPVQSVAFDRKGLRMVTASLDGTARMYESGPWSPREWTQDDRQPLVALARRQTPSRSRHVIGFDREPTLERLESLGTEINAAADGGAIDAIARQGLYLFEPGSLTSVPELACRAGDLLYRINNVDVSDPEDAALALAAMCTRIRAQADRPHAVRFEFANFLERRIVEFRFPQLVDRELTVPRPLALQVLATGIKNSKDNRLRWAEEKGPRETDVVILTDLTLYAQIGLEAQDRLVSFNGVPISSLDSVIEGMEKTQQQLEAGELTSAVVLYARDRLDQLIRVTFKITG